MKKDINKAGKFDLIHIASGNQANETTDGSKVLNLLIGKSEDPSTLCSQMNNQTDKATPLHFAAVANNANNVRILIK